MKLCSACLLWIPCRYDGKTKPNERMLELASREILIPICPEQLGGLPTPRKAAEQRGDSVITIDGEDITAHFKQGAEQVLQIAKLYGIQSAILKARSPSCGCGEIYDGTFSGTTISGDGVTARMLKENGITVFSEDSLESL